MSGGDICEFCGDWRPCCCDEQLTREIDLEDDDFVDEITAQRIMNTEAKSKPSA